MLCVVCFVKSSTICVRGFVRGFDYLSNSASARAWEADTFCLVRESSRQACVARSYCRNIKTRYQTRKKAGKERKKEWATLSRNF